MTEDLTAHILPLYRTSRNERCLCVYCSLTMVRTVRPIWQGRLQALYPVNWYSTVRWKKEFTLVLEGHEYKSRSSTVIDPSG